MIRLHILRVILFALIGLGIGAVVYVLSPRVYESRTQLLIGSDSGNAQRQYSSPLSPDVASILAKGEPTAPITELQILRGESLFYQAASETSQDVRDPSLVNSWERYYKMYDVYGDKESNAALVLARAFNPETARILADKVATVYNSRRRDAQRQAVQDARAFLQTQLTSAKKDLDKARDDLKLEKQKTGVTDVTQRNGQQEQYIKTLEVQYGQAVAEYSAAQGEFEALEGRISSVQRDEIRDRSTSPDPVISQLRTSLNELYQSRDQLRSRFFDDSIEVKEINARIKSAEADLKKAQTTPTISSQSVGPNQIRLALEQQRDLSRARAQGAQQRQAALKDQLDKAIGSSKDLPQSEADINRLDLDVRSKEATYIRLAQQFDELTNRTEVSGRSAVVLFPALKSDDPVSPNPLVCALVGVIGGGVFGLLFSFALESLRVRIYSSAQLNEFTGYPVAAVVPAVPGPTARRLLGALNTDRPSLFEGYRYLAYSSPVTGRGEARKILFTGVDFSDGCTTSAAQFATALSNTGMKVLLVDADLQGQTATKVFDAASAIGVSDVLSKTILSVDMREEAGKQTNHANLRVMPAGKESPNSIKDAPTTAIEGLVTMMASGQNAVVVDAPPCTISSDASRLVPFMDEVYLVVSSRHANLKLVAAAIDVLNQAGAKDIKFIFTHASMSEEGLSKQALYSLGYKSIG